MSDIRYYEEQPCEHGRMAAHGLMRGPRGEELSAPGHICEGGTRREVALGLDFAVFIGKHPCDDLPYIVGTVPDPRDDVFKSRFAFDGDDYSGYYVRVPKELVVDAALARGDTRKDSE